MKQVHLCNMLWFTILVFFVGLWIYLLYPIIFIISSKGHNNKEAETPEELPSVEIIIPAYLEFKNIHHLMNDCLRQHYPADLLKITLVVDGPLPENFTDQLPSKVQLLHSSKRLGKAQALNRAVALSNAEVVFFLDANIRIEAHAVQKMVQAILKDITVTMVFGRKLVMDEPSLVGSESVYWNYEHSIKMKEQNAGRLFAATGELIAMRRIHYCTLPERIILDDLYQSIVHIQTGGRLKYVHDAVSTEMASSNLLQEIQRKVRIGRGGAQLLAYVGWLPFDSSSFNYHFWHRKIARWLLFPIMLQAWIVCFLVFGFSEHFNILLLSIVIWIFLLVSQIAGTRIPILSNISRYLVYFPLMQIAVGWGFLSFYIGFQSHLWQKISR